MFTTNYCYSQSWDDAQFFGTSFWHFLVHFFCIFWSNLWHFWYKCLAFFGTNFWYFLVQVFLAFFWYKFLAFFWYKYFFSFSVRCKFSSVVHSMFIRTLLKLFLQVSSYRSPSLMLHIEVWNRTEETTFWMLMKIPKCHFCSALLFVFDNCSE
jgi:hypothetical protein